MLMMQAGTMQAEAVTYTQTEQVEDAQLGEAVEDPEAADTGFEEQIYETEEAEFEKTAELYENVEAGDPEREIEEQEPEEQETTQFHAADGETVGLYEAAPLDDPANYIFEISSDYSMTQPVNMSASGLYVNYVLTGTRKSGVSYYLVLEGPDKTVSLALSKTVDSGSAKLSYTNLTVGTYRYYIQEGSSTSANTKIVSKPLILTVVDTLKEPVKLTLNQDESVRRSITDIDNPGTLSIYSGIQLTASDGKKIAFQRNYFSEMRILDPQDLKYTGIYELNAFSCKGFTKVERDTADGYKLELNLTGQYCSATSPTITLYAEAGLEKSVTIDLQDKMNLKNCMPDIMEAGDPDADTAAQMQGKPVLNGNQLQLTLLPGAVGKSLFIPIVLKSGTYMYTNYASGTKQMGITLNVKQVRKTATRTQAEILNFLNTHPFDVNTTDSYAVTPNPTAGVAGRLSNESLQNGLNGLNFARFLAGIDADVTLNETQIDQTQKASDLNALNNSLSHNPSRPSGVSDELYQTGRTGASRSNIAMGYTNIARSILYGYMDDGDSSNRDRIGHRRWCLNPYMGTTGFGEMGRYSAMYSFDRSRTIDVPYTYVTWPGRTMPEGIMNGPWSVSLTRGLYQTDLSNVAVTLTFNGQNYPMSVWTNSGGYGDGPAIMFDPNYTFSAGDSVRVTVTGVKDLMGADASIQYNVRFISLSVPDTQGFTDVQDSGKYYYTPIYWAVQNGITSGTSATTFSPNATCTRAQIVTFLYRTAGITDVSGSSGFLDVKDGAFYAKPVTWAVQKGITSGTSRTTFGPSDPCVRAQVATFLYRFAGSPDVTLSNQFTDVPSNAYYSKAVSWAVQNGITSGTSTTTFGPSNPCTRAQIVTFLYRMMNR